MKVAIKSVLSFLVFCAVVAAAQQASAPPSSVGAVLARQFSGAQDEFVGAAEAMPEDKFNYAPTQGEFKGVRSFAQQIKHVGAANYMICSGMFEEKAPAEIGSENGPEAMKSKADIVKFARDSFSYCNGVLNRITAENQLKQVKSPFGPGTTTTLALAVLNQGHVFDHYGQVVEYLRSNGIIPPASRPQQR